MKSEYDKQLRMLFEKYQKIMDILIDNKDNDGLIRISQKDIAKKLEISQALVSKCMTRLERSDKCIEKITPGVYKVNHTDLIKYGPVGKIISYCKSAIDNKELMHMSLKEQSNLLGISIDEIKMILGYVYFINNYE